MSNVNSTRLTYVNIWNIFAGEDVKGDFYIFTPLFPIRTKFFSRKEKNHNLLLYFLAQIILPPFLPIALEMINFLI